jgi:uncharacterized protein
MRVQGTHSFTKGRREVWEALQDPQTLAATLPGVRRLEVSGPDRYALSAMVGVGSVKGIFEGTFAVSDKQDLGSCLLRGSARGASGSAQVEARVRLVDADGGGTALAYEADATVAGPIAGVGQRMIGAASKKMAAQFFDAVDRYDPRREAVASDGGAEPGTGAQRGGRTAGTEERPGAPLVFERSAGPDSSIAFMRGLAAGFALAIAGVVVGRWSARGR